MNYIVLIICFILGGLIEAIRRLTPIWPWLSHKTTDMLYLDKILISITVLLFLIGIFYQVKAEFEKKKYSIFVSPEKIQVTPGYSKKSILKIINNHDYPLYQIDLRIAVEKGDLSVDAIKLDQKDKTKMESTIGGAINGITIAWDIFGIGVITENGKREDHRYIYELDAHSTKEFIIEINADKITQNSLAIFQIVRTSTEPTDIISFDPFKMCQDDGKDFKTYYETSKTMLDQKRYKEALVCSEKAIAKEPKSAPAYNIMGIALLFQNKADEAINKFNDAIQLDPNFPKPYLNLAGVLISKQKVEDAINNLKIVCEIGGKERLDALVLWGQCLSIKKDSIGAAGKYKEAIAIDPDCGQAYFHWGLLYKNNGDCDAAIAKFQKASMMEHELKLDAYGMWGSCLENMGKYKEALQLYQTIIDKAPTSPQAERSKKSIEELKPKMEENKK
jgi:tetratricopeptide (TPR) repeat protein